MKRVFRIIALLGALGAALAAPQRADALSLDVDSIAAWGKFPRFCMDVYRWGDKFFK